jgi:hypothetical protein
MVIEKNGPFKICHGSLTHFLRIIPDLITCSSITLTNRANISQECVGNVPLPFIFLLYIGK